MLYLSHQNAQNSILFRNVLKHNKYNLSIVISQITQCLPISENGDRVWGGYIPLSTMERVWATRYPPYTFFGFCISEQWVLMHSEVVLFLNFGYLSLHAKAKPKGTFIRYTITWQFWATKSGCSLRYMHAQFMLTRMSALTDRSHNAPCHLKFCQVIQDHLKLLVHRLVGCAYYSTITMSMSHNFWDIGYSHI